MKIHKSLTQDVITDMLEESTFGYGHPGACIRCGEIYDNCEPDMEKSKCDECGDNTVYGALNLSFL